LADFESEKRRDEVESAALKIALRESMMEKERLEGEKLREESLIQAVILNLFQENNM